MDIHERPPMILHKTPAQSDFCNPRWTSVDPLAEVDGHPPGGNERPDPLIVQAPSGCDESFTESYRRQPSSMRVPPNPIPLPAGRTLRLSSPNQYVTLTRMSKVKERRRGTSRISSKNQITIPSDALRSAGLEAGDRVVAHADGAGRVILEREHDVVAEFAGALTGIYHATELDDLRSEWD